MAGAKELGATVAMVEEVVQHDGAQAPQSVAPDVVLSVWVSIPIFLGYPAGANTDAVICRDSHNYPKKKNVDITRRPFISQNPAAGLRTFNRLRPSNNVDSDHWHKLLIVSAKWLISALASATTRGPAWY